MKPMPVMRTLVTLLAAWVASPLLAFQLVPMSRELAPTGAASTQSYEVVNDGEEPIAVELSVSERRIDEMGHESLVPADDDFLIYPPQIILQPGGRQTARVTWLGDPAPPHELAFRLVAEQLPVVLAKEGATQTLVRVGQVKILYRYLGSLYVRPATTSPDLVIDKVESVADDDSDERLLLIVRNRGTSRALLKDYELVLSSPGGTPPVVLAPARLASMQSVTLLSGNRRRFVVPRPKSLAAGPVLGTLRAIGQR